MVATSSEKAVITTFPITRRRTSPTPIGRRPRFLLSGTVPDAINGAKDQSSISSMHIVFISDATALRRSLPALR